MNSRYDEGSPPERSGGIHALQREERPEVKSFPKPDLIGKPLVAFEALPAHTALPSTWGSGTSRSPVVVPDIAAEASLRDAQVSRESRREWKHKESGRIRRHEPLTRPRRDHHENTA
jgi:hypothetical protein